jgi:hypothetical protein
MQSLANYLSQTFLRTLEESLIMSYQLIGQSFGNNTDWKMNGTGKEVAQENIHNAVSPTTHTTIENWI